MIAASHPRPVTAAQLATELHVAEGALNVTLRSLLRRRMVTGVPVIGRERCGWTLAK